MGLFENVNWEKSKNTRGRTKCNIYIGRFNAMSGIKMPTIINQHSDLEKIGKYPQAPKKMYVKIFERTG